MLGVGGECMLGVGGECMLSVGGQCIGCRRPVCWPQLLFDLMKPFTSI